MKTMNIDNQDKRDATMIINTGSRTDIPAYYSKWFYNRIQEGFVMTRNPYYPEQVIRYRLSPEVVDILVFCTKNPEPMLNRLEEIRGFRQFWHVTITPYGKDIEPKVPNWDKVMTSLRKLSEKVGKSRVAWRYDPIFISEKYSLEYHLKSFETMAAYLNGSVNQCVISFIDLYEKTRRNFPDVREVSRQEQVILTQEMVRIGEKNGISIRTCLENLELEKYGADVSGCLTKKVLEEAIGGELNLPKGKGYTRDGCDCVLGNDIGMYNSCGHGCLYCYANYDRKTVVENMKQHSPDSPFLIGWSRDGDIITGSRQITYYSGQMKLFN